MYTVYTPICIHAHISPQNSSFWSRIPSLPGSRSPAGGKGSDCGDWFGENAQETIGNQGF